MSTRDITWFTKRAEKLKGKLISKHKKEIPLASDARRFVQKNMDLVYVGVRKGHSHRAAATERNTATETMLDVVSRRGYVPYVISPSPREKGVDGHRGYHTLADLRQDYKKDKITKNHMIIMTDVDYYVDMHEMISYGVPILCYTFQPSKVSGPVKDGFYTIKDNMIHYRVNGGKDVSHRTWNYNQDTVYTYDPVTRLWPTIRNKIHRSIGIEWACAKLTRKFGIGPGGRKITVSTIDQFQLSEHRNIVSIVPFARCKENLIPLCKFGAQLEQTVYKQPGTAAPATNAITYIGDDGPEISLGEEGKYASVALPLKTLECLRTAFNLSKTNNLSDTVRRSKVDHHDAAIIHQFLVSSSSLQTVEVHKPGNLAIHYQSAMKKHDLDPYEQGKTYARDYAPGPLSQTAVFPTESMSNERATIEGRITTPQKKAKASLKLTGATKNYAREFVNLMVPHKKTSKGTPYSVAHVEAQQQKPLQRARNDANRMHDTFDMITKAFQKKEAYSGPNHPRNISTVPHTQNAKLSGFTYAFKDDILKYLDWYTPCKTPLQIASLVQDLAAKSTELVETDYSRFDGTFTEFVRNHVEFAVLRKWVRPEHAEELEKLLSNEANSKAFTKMGIKYFPEWTRLSGSPLTTDGNSIANAFVSYCANRNSGMLSNEAFQKIGLVYGDDGLRNGEASDDTLMTTASGLGFDLKIINRATCGNKVSFLSRIYADPWTSPASVQSPARTLLKLHTTCDAHEDIEAIGWAKTQAYLVTDGKTPFISEWCRAYQRCCTSKDIDYNDFTDIPYWTKDQESLNNSWPQESSDIWLQVVADDLEVSVAELCDHIAELEAFEGEVADLPRLETSLNQKPKLDVIMRGEIHAGPTVEQIATDLEEILDSSDNNLNSTGETIENGHPPDSPSDQRPSRTDSRSVPGAIGAVSRPDEPRFRNRKRDANPSDKRPSINSQAVADARKVSKTTGTNNTRDKATEDERRGQSGRQSPNRTSKPKSKSSSSNAPRSRKRKTSARASGVKAQGEKKTATK